VALVHDSDDAIAVLDDREIASVIENYVSAERFTSPARYVLVDGQPVVSRDYRLATDPPTVGNLYVQGNAEHTHGLTSSLLSNIAVTGVAT
jgi:hypothetical protein